jgi:hypothetical protein
LAVSVSRVRYENGDFVLLTDDQVMEQQLNKMFEFSAGATGNDFLTTFARLSYYTSTWTNLMRYLDKKVNETKSYSKKYVDMQKRMLDAEKGAGSLNTLKLFGDADAPDYALFLSVQAAWYLGSLGIEEYTTGGFFSTQAMHAYQAFLSAVGLGG